MSWSWLWYLFSRTKSWYISVTNANVYIYIYIHIFIDATKNEDTKKLWKHQIPWKCLLFRVCNFVCLFFFPILPRFHGTQKKRTWENTMAEHVQPSYFPTSFLDTKNPKAAIPNPYNLNRIPELLVPEIMDAMHTVCLSSCLRLAMAQHCTLPQTGGVNGKVYLIIHELKTQTLLEVVEELLRGVKGFGGWVFLLYQNILSNILHSKILNIPYEIYI